jgi:alanyl-tRNA synthetase
MTNEKRIPIIQQSQNGNPGLSAAELRERYLRFFERRAHSRIPSASLLPENDPSVLFTTAGMHPLVPFLLGEPHPQGKRLVNFQKCLRTNDIDEVGDVTHLTFFEMLGNWSLGDYFKNESLTWSYEFLVSELRLDPRRLAVTVFAGDQDAPRDDESAEIWRRVGIPQERIFFLPKADNWWGPAGATGPCGPDSEIFFDTGRPDHPGCRPGCACGKWFEIWNNVFMEYNRLADGSYQKLCRRNVDTGMGVERTLAALGGFDDIFRIETIFPLIQQVEALSGRRYDETPLPFRVIIDHLRAATFAIADGALPSNVEAGYVVRRLVRRAVRYGRELGIQGNFCSGLADEVIRLFEGIYPNLRHRRPQVVEALEREENKFRRTLERGLREYHKVVAGMQQRGERRMPAAEAFNLFETFGFPLPLTVELAREGGFTVDEAGFERLFQEHREISRRGIDQKFKGGLADHSEQTTRLHTATHLLHQALRLVLGPQVHQMGSNITPQRLRFDFSYDERLSEDQITRLEALVNTQIDRDLPVTMQMMALEDALASGALAFFSEKYGDQVKVFTIGDFSKEVCGGPHVTHTGELGHFHILRQESVGRGVMRLRATLN